MTILEKHKEKLKAAREKKVVKQKPKKKKTVLTESGEVSRRGINLTNELTRVRNAAQKTNSGQARKMEEYPVTMTSKEAAEYLSQFSITLPESVVNVNLYVQGLKRHQDILNHPDIVKECQSDPNIKVNFLRRDFDARNQIKYIPDLEERKEFEELAAYFSEQKRLSAEEMHAAQNKRGIDNKVPMAPVHAATTLLLRSAEILQWMGKMYYSPTEVQKELRNRYGVVVGFAQIMRFEAENRDKILQMRQEENQRLGDLPVGFKRVRLQKLAFLLADRMEQYEKSRSRADSAEARALLEQARKEVEGDVVKLDISGRLDIEAALRAESDALLLKGLTLQQIILSRVAFRLGVPVLQIQERLLTSFYRKFNGYTANNNIQETVIEYPSSIPYDFEEIQKIHREKRERVEEVEVVQPPTTSARQKLLQLLSEKKVQYTNIT